jgi:hypothetical protein
MKNYEWHTIQNFAPETRGLGDPDRIRIEIMQPLDLFAAWLSERGKRIVIHCGYQPRQNGYHPMGLAIDFHIPNTPVLDQYLMAERFDGFNGIGIYPDWNSPGLHVDARPKDRKYQADARWGCQAVNGHQRYVALDAVFMRYCLER